MRWIKASDRLPERKDWCYIFRQARNSRSATVIYLDFTPNISAAMQLPIEQIEWLDETPDDPDKEPEISFYDLSHLPEDEKTIVANAAMKTSCTVLLNTMKMIGKTNFFKCQAIDPETESVYNLSFSKENQQLDDRDKEIERLKQWLLAIRDENPPVEAYAQLKIMASNALEPYGI